MSNQRCLFLPDSLLPADVGFCRLHGLPVRERPVGTGPPSRETDTLSRTGCVLSGSWRGALRGRKLPTWAAPQWASIPARGSQPWRTPGWGSCAGWSVIERGSCSQSPRASWWSRFHMDGKSPWPRQAPAPLETPLSFKPWVELTAGQAQAAPPRLPPRSAVGMWGDNTEGSQGDTQGGRHWGTGLAHAGE